MPKKPAHRDRHALDVTRSIAKTYHPGKSPKLPSPSKGWGKPTPPGRASKTVLKKTMRVKKKP